MKITCPACNAKYSLPDERVQGKNKVFKIPCKRCGAEIRVRGLETAEEVGRTTLPFALDLPPQQPQAPVPIWFAGIDGKQVGPMTEAEVVEHISAGRLSAADLVWRKGFTAWTPVKDVAPFDDMVASAPGLPTPDAAPKKSPRRAQTLELSAAMIELLVKLDGQQGGEPELPPDLGTVDPPNLPPLEPEPTVVAARPTPARSEAPRIPSEPKPSTDDVETAVSPRPVEPKQGTVRVSEPKPPELKASESPKNSESRASDSRAAAPKRESMPVPAGPRADLPLPAEADRDEPTLAEPSVKIRLPEDKIRPSEPRASTAAAGKDAGKVDIKPVLPAARTESKPAKSEAKAETKPATKGAAPAGKAATAPATTGTGKTPPPVKKSGPPMGLIAGGGAAVIGIIAAVIAMSGKPADKPATTEPAAATVDAGTAAPAPAAPVAAPDVAVAAPSPDAAVAAGPDTVAAAAEDAQVAAKVEPGKVEAAAEPAKTAEAKAADDKAAEAKKAEEAKANEAKKAEEAKAAEEAKKADAAKKAEEAKAEEAKKAEAKKNAEEAKQAAAEAKKAAAEAKKAAAEEAKQKKAEADAKRKADAEAANAKKAEANDKKKAAAEEAARKKEEAAAAKAAKADEAKKKKEEEAARKKAEADAKVAAAEAKSTKKPTVSDEDLDKILQKHDAKKTGPAPTGDEGGEAGLSQQQVSAIGEKAKKKVANCYLLNADDPVEDTIKVQVLVNASGQIERATVLGKHGANKAMAGCIADEVKKLVFPTGSGASKKYTLPFRVGG